MLDILISEGVNPKCSSELGSVVDYINPLFPDDIKDDSKINYASMNYLISHEVEQTNKKLQPKFFDLVKRNKNKALSEKLIKQCARYDVSRIKKLISLDANVNYQRESGETPISVTQHSFYFHMVHQHRRDIFELLLKNGADTHIIFSTIGKRMRTHCNN